MTNLPVPAFATEEEQLAGGKALMKAGDTTMEAVGEAVETGELLWDSPYAHVRYLKKGGDLIYHVFRGEAIPDSFWGKGDYGLEVLGAVESEWPMDEPHVEFCPESVRQEAVEDDPTEPSKYPAYYYGAYLVAVPGVDERPLPPDEARFKAFARNLQERLGLKAKEWGNGGR